jgi:DNA polymerase-3 subunit delta'
VFRDVIGQEDVKRKLAEMVQHNRLSHALLFLGKEGSGALPLAMAFAQYVVCDKRRPVTDNRRPVSDDRPAGASLFGEEPAPAETQPETTDQKQETSPPDSCGTCPSCQKAAKLVHPDIHFSYPVVTKKAGSPPLSTDYATEWREFIRQFPYGNVYDWLQFIEAENKQGNITAQECNDILRKLNLKSFESGYKILVLWMPEYLGKEGNKLLKLIEEPPADTLFILVAESEAEILSTILSRCQLVRVPAIETSAVEGALVERSKVSPGQARSIAGISEGNYREALHLLQHADEDFGNLLRDWLNATLKNQPTVQAKHMEEIARMGRENQKQFLRYFTHLLEQAIRLQLLEGEAREALLESMSPFEKDMAPKLNRAMKIEQQEAVAQELDKAAYYIERNANARILFHALSIKIFHIVKNNIVLMAP